MPIMPDERVVELRVHGVSGGQAEELLDVEPAMRVSGDALAGFFRWRRRRDTECVPGVPREIFAWGNLTSGRSSRALWLLLLPFMLVNIAYWMRPGRLGPHRSPLLRAADLVYGGAVRLLALSLTALLVLAAAGVGMDLVAWQCGGYGARCAELRPLLGFLSAPGAPLAEPGRALAAGALLPLAVAGVLWRLSRRTGSVYEVTPQTHAPIPDSAAPLSDPGFWRNSETMARLRSAHIGVAAGAVAALLLTPALEYDGAGPRGTAGAVLAAALGGTLLLSTVGVLIPGTDPRWNRWADRGCALLRDAALVLLAASAVYAVWPRPEWSAGGRLPGYAAGLNALFAAQCVLGVLLLAAAAVLYRGAPAHRDTAARGMAGPVTAVFGALLGGVFSAAVVFQAAGWLGGCYYPGAEDTGCLRLQPPSAYAWLQLAFTMEAVIALVVAGALAAVLRARTDRLTGAVAAAYRRGRGERRTRDIARARALGGMTELLPACLVAFLLPAVALVGLVAYAVLTGRLTAGPAGDGTASGQAAHPAAVAGRSVDAVQDAVTAMVTVGSFLGGLFLVGLMLLGRSAYRDRPTRQGVGVLWDIGTFWPRVAHPLAPPSYAERAVPQLVARIAGMTDDGTGVVLSGHSQGSVLAAASVWQLPARCRPAVALITHGSPLYRLYARYFPAYFGPAALADVRERVAGWRNLWRATDAIGGPIRAGDGTVGYAEPLPDPESYGVRKGEALPPPPLGHSFYTHDPAYHDAVEAAVARLRRAAGDGPHPGVEVRVAVAEPGAAPRVEEAVDGLLAAFGLEVAARLPAERDPWFRRLHAAPVAAAGDAEVAALLAEMAVALRDRAEHRPAEGPLAGRSDAAAELVAAVEAAGDAVVRVGPVLLVRADGEAAVRRLDGAEQARVDAVPLLARAPGALLAQVRRFSGVVPGPRRPAAGAGTGAGLPAAVGAVGAARAADGGADVDDEDQGGDERQEGQHAGAGDDGQE
jgi:hypothetical protein